jgi:hypothetical protein
MYNLRPDLFFSYWIYAWFLIYYIVITTDVFRYKGFFIKYMNPLLSMSIALIENLITFVYLWSINVNTITLCKYLAIIILIKIIPIYLLLNKPFYLNYSIISSVSLFILYLLYMQLLGKNVINIYKESNRYLQKGEIKTPLFRLFYYLFKI